MLIVTVYSGMLTMAPIVWRLTSDVVINEIKVTVNNSLHFGIIVQ